MQQTIIKIILLLAFSIFLSACAKQYPDWAGKTWVDKNNIYFAGISGEEATLKDAKEQAYIDALRKVGEYIGVLVSAKTVQVIREDGELIDSVAKILLKDVYLSQISIKEFKYAKVNGGYVGNVLVECDVVVIEKEKRRRVEEVAKRKELLAKRKSLGAFVVVINSDLVKQIVADVKSILQGVGYEISADGKGIPIRLNLIDENFSELSQGIVSYNFSVEIIFNGSIKTLGVKGFGNSKDSARRDAYEKWIKEFAELDWDN